MSEIPNAWDLKQKKMVRDSNTLATMMADAKAELIRDMEAGVVCARYMIRDVITDDDFSRALYAMIDEFRAKGYYVWTDAGNGHVHIYVSFAHANPPEPAP